RDCGANPRLVVEVPVVAETEGVGVGQGGGAAGGLAVVEALLGGEARRGHAESFPTAAISLTVPRSRRLLKAPPRECNGADRRALCARRRRPARVRWDERRPTSCS